MNESKSGCANSYNLHYEGGVPKGWIRLRLSEAFEINPKVIGEDDDECAFIPMALIPGGYSNELRFERKTWTLIKNGFTRFSEGDIGVAKISPCLENRKSVIFRGLPSGRGAGTTELIIFRPVLVTAEYGLLFFKSEEFVANCQGTYNGVVGQQRVDMSEIRGMYINIPPVPEQKKIVETVELLFSYLDIIQRNNDL
ncbi:MAG: restriction endonuclease subunit S [Paludibacteraceae bacterium]|nr:restriction endonuclease subunit S [Paludibacteraceae bacterium]